MVWRGGFRNQVRAMITGRTISGKERI
jgi:hypothetical protein